MDQREYERANFRAKLRKATKPSVTSAHYDKESDKMTVILSTGGEFSFPAHQAQGLEKANPDDLDTIEISPSGFALYFPKLDADLDVPALLQGHFGSKHWMAAQLGAQGGQ
jgi:hypothetical protein